MTTKPCAQASCAEYTRRMNRMLNYIDAHLDHSLDGVQLVDVADFSRFHFIESSLHGWARQLAVSFLSFGAQFLSCATESPLSRMCILSKSRRAAIDSCGSCSVPFLPAS
jgi:AraC family transcriptional regulator